MRVKDKGYEEPLHERIPMVLLLGLAAWIALASSVAAQQSAPRIGYIYPAGSRQGAELDLVVGGRNLQGIATAYVSGSGVQTFAFGYATVDDGRPGDCRDGHDPRHHRGGRGAGPARAAARNTRRA